MNAVEAGWLIGANGIYGETPDGWERIGAGTFGVTAILRTQQGLLVGTDGGLWQIPAGTDQWIQWHDETLTLVQALIPVPEGTDVPVGVGMAVASAYGVATGELDELHTPRWQWHSDTLSVNCRFTNDLLSDPGGDGRWLAARMDAHIACRRACPHPLPRRWRVLGRRRSGRYLAQLRWRGLGPRGPGSRAHPRLCRGVGR